MTFWNGWYGIQDLIGRGAQQFEAQLVLFWNRLCYYSIFSMYLIYNDEYNEQIKLEYMDNKTEEGVTQETIENQQQETNSITDEMKRRDSLKVYVSNVGNYMSQKEVVKILSDHQIQGIKFILFELNNLQNST